jgi:hypothetical protein
MNKEYNYEKFTPEQPAASIAPLPPPVSTKPVSK